MKTLILPFELIQPIFLNVNYDKMEVDLFRFALRVHDLIRVALSRQFKLVVYFLEPMNKDWAQIYASQIRHHYQMNQNDFEFIPLSSLYQEAFINKINRAESLLFVLKNEEGLDLSSRKITNPVVITPEIEAKVIDWAIRQMDKGLTIEEVSATGLMELFSLIDKVSKSALTKQILYHDLEILLAGSKHRNTVLKSIVEYIKNLIEPKLGLVWCYLSSGRIVWPDHGFELSLQPQKLTVYTFFADQDRPRPLGLLTPSDMNKLAQIYVHVNNGMINHQAAVTKFENLFSGAGLAPLLANINAQVGNTIGADLKDWYTIKATPLGHAIRIRIERPDLVEIFPDR